MNDRVPRKATQHFVETELDGEAVVMNVDTGQFHALKDTALAIWRLIDGERSVGAIQSELRKSYDVEQERCRAECERFFVSLHRAGFIEGI
jgi:hypothetical protein